MAVFNHRGADPGRCDGRLTLTSGVAVTTADVTAAGTLYFTPYLGAQVSVYDGSMWTQRALTELSLTLTLTSGKPYDIFIYDNAGTLTLESLVWTNDTTRATALVMQDGVLCKTGALTRRYLGSIYASGANTTEDSATKRYVWNNHRPCRVRRKLHGVQTVASWTYSTAAWRAQNNNALSRVSVMLGLNEDQVAVVGYGTFETSAGVGESGYLSVGLDSTTVPSSAGSQAVAAGNDTVGHAPPSVQVVWSGMPGVGLHYLQLLEFGGGTATQTWYGPNADGEYGGIDGSVFA